MMIGNTILLKLGSVLYNHHNELSQPTSKMESKPPPRSLPGGEDRGAGILPCLDDLFLEERRSPPIWP
jgi:hypothetical protein